MTEIEYSHSDQFNNKSESVKDVVKSLEKCNFCKMKKESSNCYTLLLETEIPKTIIKTLLEEVLNGMGFKVEIKEDLTKLTIFLKNLVL